MPYPIQYILWRTQTPPLRTISKILWIVISGWLLFLSYFLATIPLLLSIVGIPFIPKMFQIAIFTFNPIGLEIVKNVGTADAPLRWYHNPRNFVVVIMNILWFIFFGWEFFIIHTILALVQLLTIFGIGNAINQMKIAKETLFPFGKHIQVKPVPARPVRHPAQPQLHPSPLQSLDTVHPVQVPQEMAYTQASSPAFQSVNHV